MADEIKPALAPEEWIKKTARSAERRPIAMDEHEVTGGHFVGGTLLVEYEGGWGGGAMPVLRRALPELIALANAALPDDDPRKITHEDALRLRGAIDFCRTMSGGRADTTGLEAIREKIAALLPPEASNG